MYIFIPSSNNNIYKINSSISQKDIKIQQMNIAMVLGIQCKYIYTLRNNIYDVRISVVSE